MGMDVYGTKPVTPTGEYFRNNVWWWNPLWTYVVQAHADILPGDPQHGFFNDGYTLSANEAADLGAALLLDIKNGLVFQYEQNFNAHRAEQPLEDCSLCNATGIRTDDIGVNMNMPNQLLDPATQLVVGRTHGFCNGCYGLGKRESFITAYSFSVDNVREFAMFLLSSGGASIY